ncbi:MAG: TetR/AcrR family transcriptional regulator [Bacteroidota bacterium]
MKHSLVRNKIVETASQLFYSNGYNRTGINEIIKEAGIAKATLYSHFSSKEDICVAYLQNKNKTFVKDIKEYCSSKLKGYERVLALFDFLEEFFHNPKFNGCWCINTVAEIPKENKKIQAEIKSQKNSFQDFIGGLILENMDNIGEDDGRNLAKQVYLLYEGAVAESHLHQNDWPIKEMKKVCEKIIT